ncbi:MAG: SulP family inorganic anion transporter [Candidatus Arcticimaribacter sp.]
MSQNNLFQNLKSDIPASIVVFFVAIPLCLGIALASGAPLISGLIAGIIGGLLVGALSGSQVGVSGPAAGLAAIVLTAIGDLGFENFLVAVVLGGVIQLGFGIAKAGVIGYYFPSSVIKGMLTGIGLIIILKQIPYFFGFNTNNSGDIFSQISYGSTLIAAISMGILLLWDLVLTKKAKIFQLIQGPLVAVVIGIIYATTTNGDAVWGIASSQMVSVPTNVADLDFIIFPNFSAITNINVWIVAFTIALVASLETLLCVEATDKIDPEKRITPKNRELIAQGIGNIASGMIGGLPVTQVIVRSSANIQSGGKTKMAAVIHGILLVASVVAIPFLLNQIPLSVLAAILLIVGYKLAKPALFKSMYQLGWKQFIPFVITIAGIIFTDLLVGIGLGVLVGILFLLYDSYKNSHSMIHHEMENGKEVVKIELAEEVTFINKAPISYELDNIPVEAELEIDVTKTKYLDNDIVEIINNFLASSEEKNISTRLISEKGTEENPKDISHVLEF